MNCEHCNGPGVNDKVKVKIENADQIVVGQKCCWGVALEIERFKKRVFRFYIMEALFDMVISVASVVTDIITLSHYLQNGKWAFAALTGLPILLPTLVFTNIYMADESRGYCKMPKERRGQRNGVKTSESGSFLKRVEERTNPNRCGHNCFAFISGLVHSLFHKDQNIRKRGAKLARKSIRRSMKYFFGTLVLRFIAWTWYLKALIFGVKALREPKKYMQIEEPDIHWSRELLVRLDFFQAALENAPQCVTQLYALITDSGENKVLALLSLGFSFIDFVRVATTVLWNINRGPVSAPEKCYGTLIWRLTNILSWISLYMARCAAMSLIVGTAETAQGLIIMVPILALILHCGLFAFFLSRLGNKVGQASRKLAVTTFISIFFLPDLDSTNIHVMIQLYYCLTLIILIVILSRIENTICIIPWGWDLSFTGYCYVRSMNTSPTTTLDPLYLRSDQGTMSDCLIEPVIVVLMVPAFTIMGIVFRLAAAQKMSHFKMTQPNAGYKNSTKSFTMEDRVAKIYSRKWSRMTTKEMWSAFLKMLRKEVITSQTKGEDKSLGQYKDKDDPDKLEQLAVVTNEFQEQFRNSQMAIRNSFSIVWAAPISTQPESKLKGDQMDKENSVAVSTLDDNWTMEKRRELKSSNQDSSPEIFFHNFNTRINSMNRHGHLDVQFLKVETENGVQVFDMIHI